MTEANAPKTGKYIVIEGPELVGKSTVAQRLADTLSAAGFPVRSFREPDSQSDITARAIRHLTQDPHFPMNTRTEVLLYNAARAQSLQTIASSIAKGIICICDRNYLTTLAVQYYGRGDVPDYDTINRIINFALGGLEPDLTIVMDAPTNILKERGNSRRSGERFDNLDEVFLERIRSGYLWEANQRGYPVVPAIGDRDTVFKDVWQYVAACLAKRPPPSTAVAASSEPPVAISQIIQEKKRNLNNGTATALSTSVNQIQNVQAENGKLMIEKDSSGNFTITPAGEAWLNNAVTDKTGDIYAITGGLDNQTAAAAMARLSRRGDDMRITILDEFAGKRGKDEKLLERIITAYGDDSVQQLVGQHFVVEGASQLLTKKLEWGRLAAYLEQSTRYIYFDQKDRQGRYKYYIPASLKPKTKQHYRRSLDEIFELYSSMVRRLTDYIQDHSTTPKAERDGAWRGATRAQACDAVRPVLPVATKATVGIFASGQALESLIMHLLADPLKEARTAGESILRECRKVLPAFLERADKPDRGGALVAYMSNTKSAMKILADKQLPPNHSVSQEPVQLVDYWPKSELELVAQMLYEHTDQSLNDIQNIARSLPYADKEAIFHSYMGERLNRRHRPGRALETAHYTWDLICDYGIFRDLQRHRMVDSLQWQSLSPRFGFEVPELVDKAGLTAEFERCFDISAATYSQLQADGYDLEAQYAVLLGHKMRWTITYNAREAFHLHELRTSPQGHPGYRKLVLQMHEKLAEVHPLIAESMNFVNKGEDPELTRLAAERYTQFKLRAI